MLIYILIKVIFLTLKKLFFSTTNIWESGYVPPSIYLPKFGNWKSHFSTLPHYILWNGFQSLYVFQNHWQIKIWTKIKTFLASLLEILFQFIWVFIFFKSCPCDFKAYLGLRNLLQASSWTTTEKRGRGQACQILVPLPCFNTNCSAFRSFIFGHFLKKRLHSFKKFENHPPYLKSPSGNSYCSSQIRQLIQTKPHTLDCICSIFLFLCYSQDSIPFISTFPNLARLLVLSLKVMFSPQWRLCKFLFF